MRNTSPRFEKMQRIMAREEINAIILMKPTNVFYTTGFLSISPSLPTATIISNNGETTLIVPKLEESRAREKAWTDDIRTYHPYPLSLKQETRKNFFENIKEVLKEKRLGNSMIGLELGYLPVKFFEAFRNYVPDAGFKDITNDIMMARMIKDYNEIDRIKKSLEISEKGLRTAIEIIEPGISEIEIAAEIENAMRKAGAQKTGFETIVASGPKSAQPRATAGTRKINENDFVIINTSAVFGEYYSDITRTLFLGTPNNEHKKMFETIKAALKDATERISPGTRVGDIDKAARKTIHDAGFENYFVHASGHGIGLELHEPPRITLDCEDILKPGMVLCIEPGIYKPRKGGVRIENMVLVTEEGYQILNELPEDILPI
ncbi:MAG: M24 family metallopeptidase [Candidatus Baldrarchaeia archaeon]